MSRVFRLLLAGLLALVSAGAAVPGTAGAQQDESTADEAAGTGDDAESSPAVLTIRIGGADRYETSLLAATQLEIFSDQPLDTVVLVSGERWTDAVIAAPLAGALNAPVLMTPPDELRDDAKEFLRRAGITRAVIVGSASSDPSHGPGRGVRVAVADALDDAGLSTERIAERHRHATAVAVAQQIEPGVMPWRGRTAIVASDKVFADALVAGPFAARGNHPVLLNPRSELRSDVAAYLLEAEIEHVVLMGGTAALGQAVEDSVRELGINVTRLAGTDRYGTAVLAAEFVDNRYTEPEGTACFDNRSYGLARAHVPFDAFSAAPLLSLFCSSLLLTDPAAVPDRTALFLDHALSADLDGGYYLVVVFVFGGDAAVSQDSLDAYLEAATDRIAERRAEGSATQTPEDGSSPGG